MQAFFDFLTTAFLGTIAIGALFLILMAMPRSALRGIVQIGLGWLFRIFFVLCLIYIVSPLDALPDFMPILGQIDDVGAFFLGLISLFLGQVQIASGQKCLDQ